MTTNRTVKAVALVVFGALFGATASAAQLANASATTLGLGENGMASARGLAAISLNPAGLGMPGSGFSLAFAPVRARSGLGPVKLGDLADFENTVVPSSTKEDWLSRVADADGQTGSVGAEITELALAAGKVGFQVSTLVSGDLNLAPDIVELILYGNAGRTGTPASLSLRGSSLDAFAVTTAGLSVGLPLSTTEGSMALGVTLKYSVGHVIAIGRERGGSLQSDPIKVDVNFPIVTFDDEDASFDNGSGLGLDVGFQMKRDRMSFGATVQNLFNSFSWSEDNLVFRPGTASLEEGSNDTDFDKRDYSAAPADLKQAVEDMGFDPTISVGGAYDVNEDLTVSADLRNRFGDGLNVGPKLHVGAGAEYRGLRVLHLRGGAAIITDGVQLGGGLSLVLGPVNLSAAGAIRTGDMDDTALGQFTLSFGGR